MLGKLNVFGNFLFCILFIMYLVLFFVDCYVVIFCFFVYLLVVIKNKVCGVCLLLWIYLILWVLLFLFGVVIYECFIFYIGKCIEMEWLCGKGVVFFIVLVVCCLYGVVVLIMCCVYFKIFKIVLN